jgi:hypothetical protein
MRIIRHSHTSARITEFVKDDRARVNIKVTPSLQYTDGIELRESIDDTTAAIVYLRLDDLRMIASRTGTATGSKPGSTLRKRDCITMCWRSRLPTGLLALLGRFSTRNAHLNASRRPRPISRSGSFLASKSRLARCG